jgi:hypothetical protein
VGSMEDCMIDFDKEPDFINEQGIKWWFDSVATKYAQDKGLNNIMVWAVEQGDKTRTFVITQENGDSAEVVYETKRLEDVFYHIDILWLATIKK